MSEPAAIEFRDVSCARDGAAVREVSLRLAPASLCELRGDDGRHLLLRLASLMDAPDSGTVALEGQETAGLDESALTTLRSRRFGFVFDSPYLLPGFSVVENVAMPLLKLHGVEFDEALERTKAVLDFVGVEPLEEEPFVLSAFDRQRVALARALVHRPGVLVLQGADAGLADPEAAALLDLARRARDEHGLLVLASFAAVRAGRAGDRVLSVRSGSVLQEIGGVAP